MIKFGVLVLPFVLLATLEVATSQKVFNGEGCELDLLFLSRYKRQISQLSSDVHRIINHVIRSNDAGKTYEELAYFVDKFGPRLTGTKTLENAIDYMLRKLQQEGHDNVHGERVKVPVWTRGREYAFMIKPRIKQLNILGLGYSVGTNETILEAPVLVVKSFEDLEAKADQVPGKIVVYNFKFESYGKQVVYRSQGASRASKYGAVAALVRSVTPFSINSPHAGMQTYQPNVTKIPAVSITTEDADLFQRYSDRNETIVIRLYSENKLHDSGYSRNTVSELTGSKYPKEVVLVSGHLDSWDVGQGAMDDGGGAFISWRALSVIRELGLKPKRTLRSVLWTGEEVGLIGASSYVNDHLDELNQFTIAMESDIGTFSPLGLTYSGKNRTAQCILHDILKLMRPLNATKLVLEEEGSDVTVFLDHKVPITSLVNANDKYFYFHHTEGDTMTVLDPEQLDRCLALWASASFALASLDDPLPR